MRVGSLKCLQWPVIRIRNSLTRLRQTAQMRVYSRSIDFAAELENPRESNDSGCMKVACRERGSKHPCDQFAQDDTEMREAVLKHVA